MHLKATMAMVAFKFMNYAFYVQLKKNQNLVYSFTCIFPHYLVHDITKEFGKNANFENMTAGFFQRCQNLLRYFTPKMMHFRHEKKVFNQ